MTLNKGQQILGLIILLACVLSIPAGLIGKSKESSQDSLEKETKKFSLLGRKDRILVIKLCGMIYNDEDQSSIFPDPSSPSNCRKQLRKAADNEHIKGVLLRINSPGGTVAMSQEIYDAVKALKSKGKPVIVSMGDVAASGGYYISAAADRIIAEPGTLTGSIGVIMHLMNLSEIEKKIGIEPVVIKSGAFKDIGSMDRPPTKEEKDLLQAMIMDSYDQFVTAVSDGRKMTKDEVKKLADGRIYTGRQALKVKLVDELGGYEESIQSIKKACREKYSRDFEVDEGKSSMGFLSTLLESSLRTPKVDLLKDIFPQSMSARFNKQPLWVLQ